MNPREVLDTILTIIEYRENKEQFIDEFLNKCFHRAFVSYLSMLPSEKREALQKQLIQNENNIKKTQEIIQPFVEREDYAAHVQKATTELFQELLQSVSPHLTQDQRKRLGIYITSIFQAE